MEDKPASANVPTTPLDHPPRGSLATLGLFLIGDGDAIRRLAATPRLWLVGLLFTFSAGLAREYDAEDLLAEPWHLLIAPGASLVAATALWLFVQLSGIRRWVWSPAKPQTSSTQPEAESGLQSPPTTPPPPPPRLRDNYLTFLGLFWMTAPLAWLYGIPFERFQSAGEAASSNLWLLAVIAFWRVVLIIRVLQVLYGIGGVIASIIVLLFATVVMLVALFTMPVPIFVVMGGVRLNAADQSLALLAVLGKFIGSIVAVVLALLWPITFMDKRRWCFQVAEPTVRRTPIVVVALLAIAWWCIWMPVTQPEQRLRGQVERALRNNDFATGLSVLAGHPLERFPPHWDPPPRVGYANSRPDPVDVLLYLVNHPMEERLHRLYEQKLLDQGRFLARVHRQHQADILKLVTLLERMPDASRLLHPTNWEQGFYQDLEQYGRGAPPDLQNRIATLLARYPEPKP